MGWHTLKNETALRMLPTVFGYLRPPFFFFAQCERCLCVMVAMIWGCLFAPVFADIASESRADSLFGVALATKNEGDLQVSIKAFKQVVNEDRNYAPAYEQLARLYLQEDTPDSRRLSEVAVRQAIFLKPDDPRYQLLLGDVMLFRGFRHNAGEYYDAVLAKFPNAPEVALKAGRNSLQEFMLTKDRVVDMGPGATREFAQKAWDRTVLLLEKSIDLDSNVRDGYYLLGLAHLEHNKPVGLVQTMSRLLKRSPEDKDAMLFLALAFQERGQINRAGLLYEEALKRMTLDERAMMEDVDLIASEEERFVLASLEPQAETWEETPESRKFWIQRDPLLLTDANERRLEHYKRVAYSNLRFSVPSRGEVGWKTVPGQTYIKFGRYLHRSSNVALTFNETWYYENFTFTFRSVNGVDKWGFAGDVGESSAPDLLPDTPFSWEMGNGRSAFDEDPEVLGEAGLERRVNHNAKVNAGLFVMHDREAFEKQLPRFVDPFGKQKYSMPHMTAAFREGDSVRVEMAYAVPVIRLKQSDGVALDDGLFVFDEGWKDVYRGVFRVKNEIGEQQTHLVQTRTLRFPYGDYHLIAEVGDRLGGSVGTFREQGQWAMRDSGLAMSDLLLASRIVSRKGFPEKRADLRVTPNPLRTFSRGQSAFVYLELYNLAQDDFGRTHYDIAYRVGMPHKGEVDPSLFEAISMEEFQGRLDVIQKEVENEGWGNFDGPQLAVRYVLPERNRLSASLDQLRQEGRQGDMVIASEYAGDQTDDFTFLEIDLADMPPGVYKLTVMATDQKTAQQTQRSELFRVIP